MSDTRKDLHQIITSNIQSALEPFPQRLQFLVTLLMNGCFNNGYFDALTYTDGTNFTTEEIYQACEWLAEHQPNLLEPLLYYIINEHQKNNLRTLLLEKNSMDLFDGDYGIFSKFKDLAWDLRISIQNLQMSSKSPEIRNDPDDNRRLTLAFQLYKSRYSPLSIKELLEFYYNKFKREEIMHYESSWTATTHTVWGSGTGKYREFRTLEKYLAELEFIPASKILEAIKLLPEESPKERETKMGILKLCRIEGPLRDKMKSESSVFADSLIKKSIKYQLEQNLLDSLPPIEVELLKLRAGKINLSDFIVFCYKNKFLESPEFLSVLNLEKAINIFDAIKKIPTNDLVQRNDKIEILNLCHSATNSIGKEILKAPLTGLFRDKLIDKVIQYQQAEGLLTEKTTNERVEPSRQNPDDDRYRL